MDINEAGNNIPSSNELTTSQAFSLMPLKIEGKKKKKKLEMSALLLKAMTSPACNENLAIASSMSLTSTLQQFSLSCTPQLQQEKKGMNWKKVSFRIS